MVTLQAARASLKQLLTAAEIQTPALEANLLLEAATGRRMEPPYEGALSEEEWGRAFSFAKKRCEGFPIQYLLGRWPFMDFELAVGPGVLIPRQDTETVCEQAIALAKKMAAPPACILDLCSGSGAIALAMKRAFPAAQVTAVELSQEALFYLRLNGEGALLVKQGDVFTYQSCLAAGSVQLLTANPPYLTEGEMACLQREVTFEPAMALAGGEDGLLFYRHIARAYRPALSPGGVLVFEIGALQRQAVEEICRREGYSAVGCKKDLAGNDRCVFAVR